MGAWLGRKAKTELKLGICGEHGGDPDSIAFFQPSGIDYVSCCPYRVPVARVAAAQAAVARRRTERRRLGEPHVQPDHAAGGVGAHLDEVARLVGEPQAVAAGLAEPGRSRPTSGAVIRPSSRTSHSSLPGSRHRSTRPRPPPWRTLFVATSWKPKRPGRPWSGQLSSVMNAASTNAAAHSRSVFSHAVRRTFSPSRS